eukprot:TRINITY_DN5868_c0_g1_i1.p1 TRINITY_DN5868_c0_g1~~TRINITY_DN5868_c0_g1_i1.p1  ORF type:complete len:146 (+),score=8.70 TRINITY_DN5868_c0_g1_i1:116-553(+)
MANKQESNASVSSQSFNTKHKKNRNQLPFSHKSPITYHQPSTIPHDHITYPRHISISLSFFPSLSLRLPLFHILEAKPARLARFAPISIGSILPSTEPNPRSVNPHLPFSLYLPPYHPKPSMKPLPSPRELLQWYPLSDHNSPTS